MPQTISIGIGIPKPNHPDHLCNHYIGGPLSLPVGTSDPVERLIKINFDYDKFTTSTLPEMIDVGEGIVGLLPYLIAHIFKPTVSAIVSIVHLGNQNEFFGCPIGEYHNSFPVPAVTTNSGMVILGILNNGCLHLRGTFDKSILGSDNLAKEIMEGIDAYYDSLLIN